MFTLKSLNLSPCTVPNVHLILSNRCHVLSQFRFVLSENRLVLSVFQLVHTNNSIQFVEKTIMYCPTISLDFVELLSCTVPNSTCTVRKSSCTARISTCIYPLFNPNLLTNSSCTVPQMHLILSNHYLVLS